MTKDSILYGSSLIEYEIEYVPRKTLGISVNPDGAVTLKAPLEATPEDIREKVRRRAAWILRQKRYFESFGIPTAVRQYISVWDANICSGSKKARKMPSDTIATSSKWSVKTKTKLKMC